MNTIAQDAHLHPTCVLGHEIVLGAGVRLGPFVVLGDRVDIGPGSSLNDGVCIGSDVRIGAGCTLHAGAVLLDGVRLGDGVVVGPNAVIGADGFGFIEDGGVHHKIPQVGGVRIEAGVQVGPGACIDRGTTSDTVVGEGSVIGALTQVGHNVHIGSRCRIGVLTGIAGSCVLEEDVTLGDGVGTTPHQIVRRGVVAESRTGITKEVPAESHVEGYPMRPVEEHRWLQSQLDRVPALVTRLAAVEARLGLGQEAP